MELQKVKQLLEKFYEGNTSLEEEKYLLNYFRGADIPDELLVDKELFLSTSFDRTYIPVSFELKANLDKLINNQVQKENKTKRLGLFYKISSVAATLAIIIVSYFILHTQKPKLDEKDTYQDPKIAYEQVKKALLYISENLNEGTKPLKQVSHLDQGIQEFSVFSSFNSGLKDLELVSKYYNNNSVENKKYK